jgi:hypothetical protein
MRWNPHGRGSVEFQTEMDCTDLLALNASLRNRDNFSGSLWAGRSMVHVASIPLAELERWQKEEDINIWRNSDEDKAKLMRKLNDPAYAGFRTAPGRV